MFRSCALLAELLHGHRRYVESFSLVNEVAILDKEIRNNAVLVGNGTFANGFPCISDLFIDGSFVSGEKGGSGLVRSYSYPTTLLLLPYSHTNPTIAAPTASKWLMYSSKSIDAT